MYNKEIYITNNGIRFYFVDDISTSDMATLKDCPDYDKNVARCHLSNYGMIFCYENGDIIDNENDMYDIEEFLQPNRRMPVTLVVG